MTRSRLNRSTLLATMRRVTVTEGVAAAIKGVLLANVVGVVSGCAVGPNFEPPTPPAAAAWRDPAAASLAGGARVDTAADPDPRWWLAFKDPQLSALIDQATKDNPDVQIAVIRIAEARASERSAAAAGLPKLGGNAGYTRAGLGDGFLGGATTGAGAATSGILSALDRPVNLYDDYLDASWELDFFGKVRRSVESANAAASAAIGNRDDALVSLEAEVAQTYAQLRAAQASRQTALEDIKAEEEILALTRERATHGLVSQLDVENATASLATTQASLSQYDNQIASSLNGLAVLVGKTPGTLDAELTPVAAIPAPPPKVPIGIPSTLARRRPDIRVAEAQLHQQTANVGVAVANFYPSIKLTGEVGLSGMQPRDLTTWASHFYAFGPTVSIPIFEGGQLRANLTLAKAQQAEAAVNYRKTVLGALRDVENALASYRTELKRHEALEVNVRAEANALEIARNQYLNGVSTFIDVLTAENALSGTHQNLIQSTLSLTTDTVSLYKALGGGWEWQDEKG